MGPLMVELLASQQPLDYLRRLQQALHALVRLGPIGGGDVLVKRLSGAQPQGKALRIEGGYGSGGLGQHGGMVAITGYGHTCSQGQAAYLPQGTKHRPDEAALPLLGYPGLQMVRYQQVLKTRLLRHLCLLQELGGSELFAA